MRVAMIGTGYVGLVSGACFADFGHEVTCVDKDKDKIDRARARRDADLRAGPRRARRQQCPRRAAEVHHRTEAGGGARPTRYSLPSARRRGAATATPTSPYVYDAAREIAAAVKGFTVVVTKSTVPVGTGDEVERIIAETRPDGDCAVVSNPEFLREGAAIQDFKHPGPHRRRHRRSRAPAR